MATRIMNAVDQSARTRELCRQEQADGVALKGLISTRLAVGGVAPSQGWGSGVGCMPWGRLVGCRRWEGGQMHNARQTPYGESIILIYPLAAPAALQA